MVCSMCPLLKITIQAKHRSISNDVLKALSKWFKADIKLRQPKLR